MIDYRVAYPRRVSGGARPTVASHPGLRPLARAALPSVGLYSRDGFRIFHMAGNCPSGSADGLTLVQRATQDSVD
jgi:hypothetical protein